jgi:hypothetical protein
VPGRRQSGFCRALSFGSSYEVRIIFAAESEATTRQLPTNALIMVGSPTSKPGYFTGRITSGASTASLCPHPTNSKSLTMPEYLLSITNAEKPQNWIFHFEARKN